MDNKVMGVSVIGLLIVFAGMLLMGAGDDMDLAGNAVAVMIAEEFNYQEASSTINYLQKRGAIVTIIGPKAGQELTPYDAPDKNYITDEAIREISVEDYDALVVPGGYSADELVSIPEAIDLVNTFVQEEKPTAAICAGPKVLTASGSTSGRNITSAYPDLAFHEDKGAKWVNQAVVIDGCIITSQGPDDLLKFNRAIGEMLIFKGE